MRRRRRSRRQATTAAPTAASRAAALPTRSRRGAVASHLRAMASRRRVRTRCGERSGRPGKAARQIGVAHGQELCGSRGAHGGDRSRRPRGGVSRRRRTTWHHGTCPGSCRTTSRRTAATRARTRAGACRLWHRRARVRATSWTRTGISTRWSAGAPVRARPTSASGQGRLRRAASARRARRGDG